VRESSSQHGGHGALVVWKFNDGLRGHENQTSGLIEALAREADVRSYVVDVPRGAGQLRVVWRLLSNTQYRDWPTPDLLVGAGHSTHLPLVVARRLRGGRSVVVMSPSLPTAWFDLVICPNHDRIPDASNVLVTRGALNRSRNGSGKNPGEGLILIGGPDRYYGWSVDELTAQIEQILKRNPDVHWMAASSRRTPGNLLAHLERLGAPNLSTFAVEDVDVDWLPLRLANAATVWVTEDSVSMIHEAITAGAATGLLAVPRLKSPDASATRWFEEGIGTLLADSMVTSFADWEAGRVLTPTAKPLDEAQRCADWILEEWFPTPR
jgi:mitochondrial fission protein ELM1